MAPIDYNAFQPRTLDKAERLLDVLEEMGRHPDLRGKLALHGGTAINLFMFEDMPRLSVDIDVSYIGATDRETMLKERPVVERALAEVADALGYAVSAGKGGHAGRTFVLNYQGDWGRDHIKIDCIYMNRSPLVAPQLRTCALRPNVGVLMFCDAELAGGKVKAFFDRIKVRNLYDVSNLEKVFSTASPDEESFLHQSTLYYASLSARFPQPLEGRSERFADRQTEFEDQLLPMLRTGDGGMTLQKLVTNAENFILKRVLPRNDSEQEYLRLFAKGNYQPDLVFGPGNVTDAASKNPEALWKVRNLKRALELGAL